MKKALLLLPFLLIPLALAGSQSQPIEVLLLTASATEMPADSYWSSRLIQNGGPNSIFCALGPQTDGGTGAVADKSFEIASGGALRFPVPGRLYCIAKTANQLTGAATRVLGVP